jgi:AraC-like DNA-binding protein
VTASRLNRAFIREHGYAVPEYQRRVRLLNALEKINEGRVKIEAVALGVGYHSKKNFYRTFQRLTGLTPTRFRHLSRTARIDVIDGMRLSLVSLRARTMLPPGQPADDAPTRASRPRGRRRPPPSRNDDEADLK